MEDRTTQITPLLSSSQQLNMVDFPCENLIFRVDPEDKIETKNVFLCNEKGEVLWGNYYVRNDSIKKVFICSMPILEDALCAMEDFVYNDKWRRMRAEKEIYSYILKLVRSQEEEFISLFSLGITKDTRVITQDTYIDPGAYDYNKNEKRRNIINTEENENLFGSLGE